MKIVVAYIAVTNGKLTQDYAARFVSTWLTFPPGVEHNTMVICNGGPINTETALIFSSMKAVMFPRVNDGGWDISGYIQAAKGPCANYDIMVCCGESVYFHREGWLDRFVEAWYKFGEGMYGALSSNLVRGHLNTTGFCCSPKLLAGYPRPVKDRASRYEFEHGKDSFWRRLSKFGHQVKLVTWDGEYDHWEWRRPPNILWRGDQSNCLIWCQHTDRYVKMDEKTKRHWARNADRPFK